MYLVGTNIRVTEETKEEFSRLKREDETWDEFLRRLADGKEPVDIGAWSDDEADRAREAVERSRESFDR